MYEPFRATVVKTSPPAQAGAPTVAPFSEWGTYGIGIRPRAEVATFCDDVLKLLKSVEQIVTWDDSFCPDCGDYPYHKDDVLVHRPDCKLVALRARTDALKKAMLNSMGAKQPEVDPL